MLKVFEALTFTEIMYRTLNGFDQHLELIGAIDNPEPTKITYGESVTFEMTPWGGDDVQNQFRVEITAKGLDTFETWFLYTYRETELRNLPIWHDILEDRSEDLILQAFQKVDDSPLNAKYLSGADFHWTITSKEGIGFEYDFEHLDEGNVEVDKTLIDLNERFVKLAFSELVQNLPRWVEIALMRLPEGHETTLTRFTVKPGSQLLVKLIHNDHTLTLEICLPGDELPTSIQIPRGQKNRVIFFKTLNKFLMSLAGRYQPRNSEIYSLLREIMVVYSSTKFAGGKFVRDMRQGTMRFEFDSSVFPMAIGHAFEFKQPMNWEAGRNDQASN